MLTWKDVKKEITVLDDSDIKEINFSVELVSEIIKRRLELGITQRQLADMTGIKQSAIARLESFRASPKLETIYKILGPLELEIKVIPK